MSLESDILSDLRHLLTEHGVRARWKSTDLLVLVSRVKSDQQIEIGGFVDSPELSLRVPKTAFTGALPKLGERIEVEGAQYRISQVCVFALPSDAFAEIRKSDPQAADRFWTNIQNWRFSRAENNLRQTSCGWKGLARAPSSSYAFWWRPGSERTECSLQLSQYNTAIASCGIDATCSEAWKDPDATKNLVERLFQKRIPECPSGGVYSIAYGRRPHSSLPTLVCWLEGSCGYQYPIDYTVSISVKRKNTEAVIHLW